MQKHIALEKIKENLPEIQQRFGVKQLALFGSIARDQAQPQSDIDILVDFIDTPSFDNFMDLKFYLEDLLAAPVDLVTSKALRPPIKQAIEQELIHVA